MKWMDRSEVGNSVVAVLAAAGLVPPASSSYPIHPSKLIDLLGEPDFRSSNHLAYFLRREGAEDYMLELSLRNGRVVGASTCIVTH
jgi:hypothetical protein